VHPLGGFTSADTFGQVGEHLPFTIGETAERMGQCCVPSVMLTQEQPEDGTHHLGRQPCFAAHHAPDGSQQLIDRLVL
jgi:hypothetical protein